MGGKSYINILHSLDKEMVNKLVRMVETFNGQLTRKFAEENKGDSQDETYPVDLAHCYFRIALLFARLAMFQKRTTTCISCGRGIAMLLFALINLHESFKYCTLSFNQDP